MLYLHLKRGFKQTEERKRSCCKYSALNACGRLSNILSGGSIAVSAHASTLALRRMCNGNKLDHLWQATSIPQFSLLWFKQNSSLLPIHHNLWNTIQCFCYLMCYFSFKPIFPHLPILQLTRNSINHRLIQSQPPFAAPYLFILTSLSFITMHIFHPTLFSALTP